MTSASELRLQIESTLAQRIPSALTPALKMIRPVAAIGIELLDDLLGGGLPIGAISELVGPECSGRTSTAISFLARTTQAAKVCAWIDVSNAFDPASAAASGVDLARLLWVRCGVRRGHEHGGYAFTAPGQYLAPRVAKRGLHGGFTNSGQLFLTLPTSLETRHDLRSSGYGRSKSIGSCHAGQGTVSPFSCHSRMR